ncbi:MAG: type II toxin-antitoxin system VapC family toxin [Promethearchaeota archaeon]
MKELIERKKKYVLLDANFLFLPIQFKIDIYEEIKNLLGLVKLIVLPEVITELRHKVQREPGKKFKRDFMKSLELLNKKQLQIPELFLDSVKIKNLGIKNKDIYVNVDDYILTVSKKLKKSKINIYIASNDKEIRKKAKKNGIKTIYMRQNRYITE